MYLGKIRLIHYDKLPSYWFMFAQYDETTQYWASWGLSIGLKLGVPTVPELWRKNRINKSLEIHCE